MLLYYEPETIIYVNNFDTINRYATRENTSTAQQKIGLLSLEGNKYEKENHTFFFHHTGVDDRA